MYKRVIFLNSTSLQANNLDLEKVSQLIKLFSVLQMKCYVLLIIKCILVEYLVILLKHLIV
jgi:hypothetical protein